MSANSKVEKWRFNEDQLAQLMEVASVVECECPNQLARVVSTLQAYEKYCRECESTSPKDAEMHATLYYATAAARHVLEEALEKLIKYENIVLE